MAGKESNIVHKTMLKTSKAGARLFLNVRGMFRTIDGERMVRAGLQAAGSSDLIGWTTVTIKPCMVGKRIAVFTAIEVKTPTGRISPEQQHFVNVVLESGGIAAVIRHEDEAEKYVKNALDGAQWLR